MKPVLETPRLMLREMVMADLDFVAAMLAHPEVMRFYPTCYSREESEAWIRRQMDRYAVYGYGLWLAVDRTSAAPVGQVGVTPIPIDGVDEPALGYLIHRPYWRRGYAAEAAARCRDWVMAHLGRTTVVTVIRPENVPSQGVARKIGMTAGHHIMYGGYEHVVFSISANAGWMTATPQEIVGDQSRPA